MVDMGENRHALGGDGSFEPRHRFLGPIVALDRDQSVCGHSLCSQQSRQPEDNNQCKEPTPSRNANVGCHYNPRASILMKGSGLITGSPAITDVVSSLTARSAPIGVHLGFVVLLNSGSGINPSRFGILIFGKFSLSSFPSAGR